MDILKDKYSITELSERLEITDHALRFYEKEFNIHIPKDDRGRRFYTPEFANIMFQIKKMRDEGLELKAIKKILISEDIIKDPSPILIDQNTSSIITSNDAHKIDNVLHFKDFLNEFRDQVTSSIIDEVASAREQLSKELSKTKLELGASMENGMRKLEARMDKHFQEVDKSIGLWREKQNKNPFKNLFK